jgi:outer membrane protein assembly factor BamB
MALPNRTRWGSRIGFWLLACLVTAPLQAENWPQWRGPANDGISHEKNLPTKWSSQENVAWKLALPGQGGATPVVWGDRIFLTSVTEDNSHLVVIGVSTQGKKLWQKGIGEGSKIARGDEGNYASPSPSTDGKHVWAFVGSGDLACYDFDGKEIWKTNLQDRYGKFEIQFGMASTPVLDGNRLYLQLIHGEGNPKTREAIVLALDKATGAEIWKAPRPSEAHSENEHSYASPVLYRDGKREFLLTHGADYIVAHSLEDGHELWRAGGLHPPNRYDSTLRFVASPLAVPGLIIVPSAKKGILLALSPEGSGDITGSKEFVLWTHGRTPDVPSPLIQDGLVYLCREDGILICLDAKTGEQIYEQRTHIHAHRASPVYADGKVYLTSRDGVISVIKAGRTFELLATNEMGDDIAASPAISNGRIYLRSYGALWAIGPAK